ncbi:MAG: hypothetical protein NVSMB26_23130 [Beijerinckiaceae bacterium]
MRSGSIVECFAIHGSSVNGMAKPDPVKDPDFQRTLKNLLAAKPKPHSEMKVGRIGRTNSTAKIDATALESANAEFAKLTRLVSSFPAHLVEHVLGEFDLFAKKPEEMFCVHINGVSADGTPHNIVFLKPSARFEKLLAALRVLANEADVQPVGVFNNGQ